MISFDIIASGSKGNATLIFVEDRLFLIDLGIPLNQLESELKLFSRTVKDIDALFITHEHADHYRGIKAISPKKQYALEGTLPSSLSNKLEVGVPLSFGNVTVTAFKTSHDAKNPCGYIFSSPTEKLVYMTDTGVFLEENLPLVKNPTYLIIESNHYIRMLMKTNRPMDLKERIMSEHGHLCNEDSAFATLSIIGENTKEVILAHLSEEANSPEVALESYQKVFNYAHVDMAKYHVRCANQWTHLLGGDYED